MHSEEARSLDQEGVARPQSHVAEAGSPVLFREVLQQRVVGVVEMLVIALIDDRQRPAQRQPRGHAVREVDLDERVLRPDLAVVVREEQAVLEIDLRREDVAHFLRSGQFAALRDETVRRIDGQDAGGADPFLGAGDQEAIRRPAGGEGRSRAR